MARLNTGNIRIVSLVGQACTGKISLGRAYHTARFLPAEKRKAVSTG